LEVLERAGGPEAHEWLETLAKGRPGTALKRLEKRPAAP
jgi:hypothetical protein